MALQNIGGTTQRSGISRMTTEYLYWNITSGNDLTEAEAEVAFEPEGTERPDSEDWHLAEVVETPGVPGQHSIRLLVGPAPGSNGVDISPPGDESVTYDVWVRISLGVERIVRRAGTLMVR